MQLMFDWPFFSLKFFFFFWWKYLSDSPIWISNCIHLIIRMCRLCCTFLHWHFMYKYENVCMDDFFGGLSEQDDHAPNEKLTSSPLAKKKFFSSPIFSVCSPNYSWTVVVHRTAHYRSIYFGVTFFSFSRCPTSS